MGGAMTPALALAQAFWLARRNFVRLRGTTLADYQDRHAQSIVAFARRHSPFYSAHHSDQPTHDWRLLPTLDKAVMMENFSSLNTRHISIGAAMATALAAEKSGDFSPRVEGLTVGLSSGTSGNRGLFLVNEEEEARWVGTVLARVAPRIGLRGLHITLFSMSGSNLYRRLRRGWLRFEHFNLATSIDEAVVHLNASPPDVLVAPPSYLHALSERKCAGELRANPKRLISVAEVLEPHVEARLRERFACEVQQIYQCTEGLIGISCKAGRLHLQEDLVAVQAEPVDAESDSVRITPVITDLWRRVQPIIRYRLNDILVLAAPHECTCGSSFRVIERIEGRVDDICRFLTQEGFERLVFPATLRQMVLVSSPDILDYEAIQERDSHLRVRVDLAPNVDFHGVSLLVRQAIEAGLHEQGVGTIHLEIEQGKPKRFITRKLRRVRRVLPGALE